jgi:hypothetical protein
MKSAGGRKGSVEQTAMGKMLSSSDLWQIIERECLGGKAQKQLPFPLISLYFGQKPFFPPKLVLPRSHASFHLQINTK